MMTDPLPETVVLLTQAFDAEIAVLRPQWQSAQENSHQMTGRYWQGAQTHKTALSHPQVSDQAEGWENPGLAALLPTTPDSQLAVDVYRGPDGDGYVLRFVLTVEGEQYQYEENHGPETHRQQPWHHREFG